MFMRIKKSVPRQYLQIVENKRVNGKTVQHVIAKLGRADQMKGSGTLDSLLASGARFSESAMVITAHKRGSVRNLKIGPALLFERLWKEELTLVFSLILLPGYLFKASN